MPALNDINFKVKQIYNMQIGNLYTNNYNFLFAHMVIFKDQVVDRIKLRNLLNDH